MPLPALVIAAALEIAKLAAPKIIGHIAGDKAEEVAERVVDLAQSVTGTSTPEAALSKLQADPNLVMQFNIRAQEIEADLDKAYLADRQSARSRDVALAQAGHYNWRSDVLALLAVGGLVLSVWFIARDSDMPERAVNAIMFVAGVLASAVRDVYGFEFGSSRDSRNKTEIIAGMEKVKGAEGNR